MTETDHQLEEKTDIRESRSEPSWPIEWLSVLGFLASTSMILALAFEWSRHERIVGWNMLGLDVWDRGSILWLLCAKSLLFCLPLLFPVGLLLWMGLKKASWTVLLVGWTALVWWITADLLVMSFSGGHAVAYLPFLYEMYLAPEQNYGNWVGSGVTYPLVILPLTIVAGGLSTFLGMRWLTMRLFSRFQRLNRCATAVGATVVLCFFVLAVVPALAFFSRPSVLWRMNMTLPIYLPLLDRGVNLTRKLIVPVLGSSVPADGPRIFSVHANGGATGEGSRQVVLHNPGAIDVDLKSWRLLQSNGQGFGLSGTVKGLKCARLSVRAPEAPPEDEDRVTLVDADGWPRHLMSAVGDECSPDRYCADRAWNGAEEFLEDVNRHAERVGRLLAKDGSIVGPVDPKAVLTRQPLPNVLILFLESFRASAVGPGGMERLDSWSRQGLRAYRHYSGSNCTHMGMFSLLYGRTPIFFDETLARQIPPQVCESLRRSGYRNSFITSCAYRGFRHMDGFINERAFNETVVDDTGAWKDFRDWVERDRSVLRHIGNILTQPADRPQFVVTLLQSTHCPYVYPPAFDRHKPSGDDASLQDWVNYPHDVLYNRYRNAALFLEDELMKLLASLDLQRTLVIITGDHGESMGEDGFYSHTGVPSEVQVRVPLIMVGPGIEPRTIHTATSHTDVLPTLLHSLEGKPVRISHCHGRDLLGDGQLSDEALVVPLNWPQVSELLLIRNGKRLAFNVTKEGERVKSVQFFTFLDESGLCPIRTSRFPKSTPRFAHEEGLH